MDKALIAKSVVMLPFPHRCFLNQKKAGFRERNFFEGNFPELRRSEGRDVT